MVLVLHKHKRSFCGVVIKGRGIGHALDFPTINIRATIPKRFHYGIYVVCVYTELGFFLGAMHYGPIPTFKLTKPRVEIHILDFSGNLYGKKVDVEICEKIRNIQTFSTLEALKKCIASDVVFVREYARMIH